MGVTGLWRLIEPSGKPVPLETLENKVLAVDVSIWLHQAIKGFQDAKGASLPNAHLLGIYHRVCKLLYFRVKPIFVFDGGVPVLKKQTIAKRNQLKQKNVSEADRLHRDLLSSLMKHSAISKVLSEKAKAAIESSSPTKSSHSKSERSSDLYALPPSQLDSTVSSSEDDDEADSPSKNYDLHTIDTQSAQFKALPADVRHEILTDLKETRKQSSWGRLHELPRESDNFSNFQMNRLLKRKSVQSALEEAEKEMGGHSLSLGELEKILKDQGVLAQKDNVGRRIASDENTRFLLIKDIRKAIEDAKNKPELAALQEEEEEDLIEKDKEADNSKDIKTDTEKSETNEDSIEIEHTTPEKILLNKGKEEFENDLQRAIALSLQDEPSTSKQSFDAAPKKISDMTFLHDFSAADFGESESSDDDIQIVSDSHKNKLLSSAQSYMMEYSGLTPSEIGKIITNNATTSCESKTKKKQETHIIPREEQTAQKQLEIKETVEIMSEESDSGSDDFLEVEEIVNKEQKTEKQIVPSMEVVIKPDDEVEDDDLFKDIFIDNKIESPKKESVEKFEKQKEEKIKENIEKKSPLEINKNVAVSETAKEKISSEIAIAKKEEPKIQLSTQDLEQMKEDLQSEQSQLSADRALKERLAKNITDQMYQEAQELLELFGVPYIVAPMEAEAQCAFLDLINLTDGTITDDSDIWLFGGRTVYKNFFNQAKHVLEYKAENIRHHFKLSREQMILLALLVGSDYTTGLSGVGPVTALEILASFPPKTHITSGLSEFKSWFVKGKVLGPGRLTLRKKLKNIEVSENFPNPQIVQAYLEPTVEKSDEKFSWGKPDVIGLIDFAKRKFGWTQKKTEEILNPALKRMEDKSSQKRIYDFYEKQFKPSIEAESKMSKRVKTAVQRIGNPNENDEDEPEVKKKKVVSKKSEENKESNGIKKRASSSTKKEKDEEVEVLKKVKKESRKRVKQIENEVRLAMERGEEKPKAGGGLKKEVIPQVQRDKSVMMKNKLRAIETFRKSKQGPGFVKKRGKTNHVVKDDAGYLSENSSSSSNSD